MNKIESLTPEQIAKFPQYVKEWTDIGLCTEPADRASAEKAINMMYETAGLKPPKIVWCGSPLSNALTRAIIDKIFRDKNFGASVWASVRDSVWDSVWDSVRDSVRDSVWASVGASVRDSVRASVGDSVWDSVWDSVGASVYGQHDANWMAFYKYFHDECGLIEQTKKLEGLWLLCKSAGWAIPHEKICWVSERHKIVKKDERGFLHCEDGSALQYPDGFSLYYWHGVRVSERIIEKPETITAKQISDEQNAEIRRAMLEKFGRDKFLSLPACRMIHKDDWGELYRNKEIRDRNNDPYCFVKVVNSTPEPDGNFKDYILRVHPQHKTAYEAVASTFPRIQNFAPSLET